MTDTLAIARSMRNSAENGGLEEKVHKVRNNGSVFTKAYRDTITGDEIINWLVNIMHFCICCVWKFNKRYNFKNFCVCIYFKN